MNDKYSTTEGKTSEKLSDEAMLSAQWKNIDWHKAEQEVNRLQIRIVKATQQKNYNAVKRLQYLLTHSFYAKALAVKRLCVYFRGRFGLRDGAGDEDNGMRDCELHKGFLGSGI